MAERAKGCLSTLESIRMYDYNALPKKAGAAQAAQKTTKYSIPADRMPKVKDQGDVGSCVAHAITSVLETLNYLDTGEWVTLSPGWFYGYARDDDDNGWGMYTGDAVEYTKKFGSVPEEMFHDYEEMPKMKQIAKARPELEEFAKPFKTISFVRIENWADKTRRWNEVKECFLEYELPLVIDSPTFFSEGHCIMAYGFEEVGNQRFLLFQNSWGESYGDKGRSRIPFEQVKGVYMLLDEKIELPFDDVPESAWYYKNVLHLYAAGLVGGDDQGHFNPEAPITRAESVAIIDRLMEKIEEKDKQMIKSVYEYIDRKGTR